MINWEDMVCNTLGILCALSIGLIFLFFATFVGIMIFELIKGVLH